MEYFNLWDSCMIKSLRLPKSGNQLQFLMHRVPSGRISNALSIPLHAFLKELIYKVLGLQVPLLELDRFGILLGEWEEGQITSSDWPFVFAVLGQMAHLVTSITLNSGRSYVMQSAFLTQGTVSNIPIVFSWSGSIRPKGFLSSVLLWLVIIIAVVGVGVTVVVVVESSYVVKLSFMIT
ncbi:hypothetical protein Tco_1362073 [Tanacetum coccineum]